ncbi:MAG: alpha/beta hydrolase [Spirochaetaceae bacterium]|nr:MAG: alpha/beta hydrolase [Spirochaetaceae bacterium]
MHDESRRAARRGKRNRACRRMEAMMRLLYRMVLRFVQRRGGWSGMILALGLASGIALGADAAPVERDSLYRELRGGGDTPLIRAYYRSVMGPLPRGARHEVVSLYSLGEMMAVHLFHPSPDRVGESPRGTVLVMHGYLSYPAEMGSVIREMVALGYVVVAPALPGHGLSGGEPGGIADFSLYGVFVEDVLRELGAEMPRPWHAVGHSTGATALYEYIRIRKPEDDPFENVVFLAPLVRSAWYRLSRVGRFLARPFASTIPSGADDPLIPEAIPLSWFDAQVEWNRRSRSFQETERPLLVVQGNADTVVAWRYNRRFLKRLFPRLRYELIRGAGHVLHGSDGEVRERTLSLIREHLRTDSAGDTYP